MPLSSLYDGCLALTPTKGIYGAAVQIQLTGSVTNMSVVDWATMHVENATDATFTNFTFSGNVGALPPQLSNSPILSTQDLGFSYRRQNPETGTLGSSVYARCDVDAEMIYRAGMQRPSLLQLLPYCSSALCGTQKAGAKNLGALVCAPFDW